MTCTSAFLASKLPLDQSRESGITGRNLCMEEPGTDRIVDERRAAALLGLPLPELRLFSPTKNSNDCPPRPLPPPNNHDNRQGHPVGRTLLSVRFNIAKQKRKAGV